jgi:hypothetical protein
VKVTRHQIAPGMIQQLQPVHRLPRYRRDHRRQGPLSEMQRAEASCRVKDTRGAHREGLQVG